jgi:murein L,D-transpeptidase YafK
VHARPVVAFVAIALATAVPPACSRRSIPHPPASELPSLTLAQVSTMVSAIARAPEPTTDPTIGLAALCHAARVSYPMTSPRLVVEKRKRRLSLFDGATIVATFRVGLGGNPEGPKSREGDGRTPEGQLRIVTRNAKSKYRKFLGLGYPTAADAIRGASNGVVTSDERDAIVAAQREGVAPPWNTRLGGTVGVHGHGSAVDWTLGCIAVDDDVIDLLWEAVPIGTEIDVLP